MPNSTKHMVLRFQRTEILLHWAIAIPFLICYLSALILILFYNQNPGLNYRNEISLIHKSGAILLVCLPPLVISLSFRSLKIHLTNIKEGWRWTKDDFKWLLFMVLNSFGMKFKMPESEKFNAAEKINFMMVMTFYPLFCTTGILIWQFKASLAAWIAHTTMAVLATPLIWGHIYMATINKETRAGLSGMITGYVAKDWAAHHYHKWFTKNFESLKVPHDYAPPICVHLITDPSLTAKLILLGQKYKGHGQPGKGAFYFEETDELEFVISQITASKIHVNEHYHQDILQKLLQSDKTGTAYSGLTQTHQPT